MAPRNRRMHIGATALASEEPTAALKTALSRGRSHATAAASGALEGTDEWDRMLRRSPDAVLGAVRAARPLRGPSGLEFQEGRETMSSRHQSARVRGG